MASSQVEFASSSSPFGCITRDHHHRDRCSRESNARATQAAFHKNFNHFVRDHLNACTHDNQINSNSDSWVPNNAKSNLRKLRFTTEREQDDSSLVSPRHWQIFNQDESLSPLLRPSSSTSRRETSQSSSNPHSPTSSDGSAEVSNLGASSLVQIWEKRLTKSNITMSTGRSSPSATCSPQGSEGEQYINEGSVHREYDHKTGSSTTENQTCSPQGQINSGVAESERVRVADIIKRLTATCDDVIDQEQSCSAMGSPRTPKQSENRVFAQRINSPRIRGRQAFTDLLMQMERDRHGELNNLAERGAVSKFSQRGRIQSLLRLRLLQRGVAANDQYRLQSTSEVLRQPQGSVIMRLRERFSTGVENRTIVQPKVVDSRSPTRDTANNVTQMDNSPSPIKLIQSASCHCTTSTQSLMSHSTSANHNREEGHPSSDVTTSINEAQNIKLQDDSVETTSSMAALKENEIRDKVERSDEKHIITETSYDEIVKEKEEEADEHEYGESNFEEIEEVETNEQRYDEASFDWINHISRPSSYWESCRQARNNEMLDTESKNEDICQLLQRRPVSTFLSSDFRDRMDRLMESHMGTQTNLFSDSQKDEELDNQGRMDQLIAFLQEQMHSAKREEEIKRGEREEHKEEILISGSYNEDSDYINQYSSPVCMLSSSLSTTWHYRDNEAGDDSDRLASTSSPQPSQPQSFYQDSPQYSSSTNHSIEMELIYDLRRHMKQLYQEMSELRKSIKGYMDMQMTLQKSMNRESHTAKGGRKSHDRALKKGNCCICYEMKADSLLYRCGHMCTCLKCANELQWNSRMCPICQAAIVDVVRVHVDA